MGGERRKERLVDLRQVEPHLGYRRNPSLHPWIDDENLAADARYLLGEAADLSILHADRPLFFLSRGGSRGRCRMDRRRRAEDGQ